MMRLISSLLLCIGVVQASYAQNINRIEYFFDADPGFGNGTSVSITPSASINDLAFSANTSALTNGFHVFQVRSRDENGKWSVVSNSTVYKDLAINSVLPNISRIEYFFDTDPGFGNGTAVSITPSASMNDLAFSANTASLSAGFHIFQVRCMDVDGKWSVVSNSAVYKEEALSTVLPNIALVEYFIDTDPGAGLATAIPFTASSNVEDLSADVDITNLANGGHYFFARSRDVNGKVSVTNSKYFEVNKVLPLTLLKYEAKLDINSVMNRWSTVNEINTSHFIIERSVNGLDFIESGSVKAKNITGQNEYRFNDYLPSSANQQIFYYRLKQVDIDGRFSYSKIVPISLGLEKTVTVSPNPTSDKITVFAPRAKSLSLISMQGAVVYKMDLNKAWDSTTISIGYYPKGTYMIKIIGEDDKVTTEKIILQ